MKDWRLGWLEHALAAGHQSGSYFQGGGERCRKSKRKNEQEERKKKKEIRNKRETRGDGSLRSAVIIV